MRELIERRDFWGVATCGGSSTYGCVTYQRSVFVDYDGFVIRTTEWQPITNSYNAGDVCGSSYVGGVCGNNLGGILIR